MPKPDNPARAARYKIEHGVPLPPSKAGRPTRYPFALMQVGDSVLIPDRTRSQVAAAASTFGSRHGWLFAVRPADDGVRVWRRE